MQYLVSITLEESDYAEAIGVSDKNALDPTTRAFFLGSMEATMNTIVAAIRELLEEDLAFPVAPRISTFLDVDAEEEAANEINLRLEGENVQPITTPTTEDDEDTEDAEDPTE